MLLYAAHAGCEPPGRFHVDVDPASFAAKWSGNTTTERASAQEHFTDLCRMLGFPTPHEADPDGRDYAFEKGAEKTAGGAGFADVWKRGHFAWEYKGPGKDLKAAYQQLLQYREALENPPLLVVCDLDHFEVHTNFTNTPKVVHEFSLNDLAIHPAGPLRILRAVMGNPEELRPNTTRAELTDEAARKFASLADGLRYRGHEPQAVAHFLNKLLFCLFAEDAGLLPPGLVKRLADNTRDDPPAFAAALADLFGKMSAGGGFFGPDRIEWFNGGLFDGPEVIPLQSHEIEVIRSGAALDWSQIEPAIFGTLFERGLDPSKRSQLGAHYTDRDSIQRLVEPVLIEPLRRDLEDTKAKILAVLQTGGRWTAATPADRHPQKLFHGFLERLRTVRVLDPACGSGNFLYLALQALKDLERDAIMWASTTLRTPMEFPEVGPQAVHGIEISPYAAELARVTIWIGEIQWMLNNGFAYLRNPILRPLKSIECRDALLDLADPNNPKEAAWPDANVIVGNPPFLGGKLLRSNLGDEYVDTLFRIYAGRVSPEADYVCYWHEKARAMVEEGRVKRVGLLATQGIRGGANRRVLERIKASGDIFLAWDDEPWILDGAAVHISFVGFDDGTEAVKVLDGQPVATINANLTAGLDLTRAKRLQSNLGIAFMGDTKGGPFEIPEEVVGRWTAAPNPDGRSNRDVLRPWVNGLDVTRRPRNMWIVDFGVGMPFHDASLYEAPFEYVKQRVKPAREASRSIVSNWWLHERPRVDMRQALQGLTRFICTPCISKHRLFVWMQTATLPDHALIVIARDDDYTFGVLQSRIHECWALQLGTQLETRPRYTPTTTFETFPFPDPTDSQRSAISAAARRLDELRVGWLYPVGVEDKDLARQTLTNLYNAMPTWLAEAHRELDAAVLDAYGWAANTGPEDLLERLLELNLGSAPALVGSTNSTDG